MNSIIYDKRKIKISYNDLFIGERLKTRDELCEHFGMTYKKLRGMGGYENVIKSFGLEPPSQYAKENERKKEEVKKFVLSFYKENGRNPMVKEIVSNTNVNKEFIMKQLGGYRNFVESLGIKHYKPNTGSHLYGMDKNFFIDTFKNAYKKPPTVSYFLKTREEKGVPFSVDALQSVFGSYVNFILECEMKPNSTMYSNKNVSNDGHICDSFSEMEIDDFLFENKISHEHHVKYKKIIKDYKSRMVSDFLLSDGTVVEYFGLIGQPKYDKKVKKKVNVLEKNNIRYIAIYPKDLKELKKVFKDYIGGEQL